LSCGHRALAYGEDGDQYKGNMKELRRLQFKCSACGYDWPSLLMPSIIFVSLSFVTDQCPNCQKRHVPAYKVGPGH